MEEKQREEAVKKIIVEIKNSDTEKQNFILGYLEALKDINALSVEHKQTIVSETKLSV